MQAIPVSDSVALPVTLMFNFISLLRLPGLFMNLAGLLILDNFGNSKSVDTAKLHTA